MQFILYLYISLRMHSQQEEEMYLKNWEVNTWLKFFGFTNDVSLQFTLQSKLACTS